MGFRPGRPSVRLDVEVVEVNNLISRLSDTNRSHIRVYSPFLRYWPAAFVLAKPAGAKLPYEPYALHDLALALVGGQRVRWAANAAVASAIFL